MNRISVNYGNGVIWYFDNYPERYRSQWSNIYSFRVLVELPSQTLWI